MAMACLAVSLPCDAADNGEATFWLGVIAFGKQADSVISARTVRPVGKTGQQGKATNALRREHEQHPPAAGHEDFDQTPPFDDGF